MNIEQARFNMIEQQIRPWNVLDQDVLDLLHVVKREQFVPAAYVNLAFADVEIPLPGGESMFNPKIEARILQELNIKSHETVLEIGAGSGYMAALMAHKARHVTTVEISPELKALADDIIGFTLRRLGHALVDDFVTEFDALVTDVHAGSGDELLDLFLSLSTEGTLHDVSAVADA